VSDESRDRLKEVRLDDAKLPPASPNAEQERRIALFDLQERNSFAVKGSDTGPYLLTLAIDDGRLLIGVFGDDNTAVATYHLGLGSLRKLIKDYFAICDSYYDAIRNASPSRIEAIDMGRRGLHDEGSQLLRDRLNGKIDVDHDTARRLFTLICALRMKV